MRASGPTDSADPFGHGSITDVDGVRVGHHQRIGQGWQTGTTVVFCPAGATAAVDVRGGGPGTRETDALAPTNLVDRIHAVCLTGGSAYGLSAADGVMAELERRRLGVRVGPEESHIVPVVPTAVIFDLGRGGRFERRPGPEFGTRATRRAATRRSGRSPAGAIDTERGAVGAGTGAVAGGFQGGVGMASLRVELDASCVTVGALAVVNAAGSPIDPATGLPWTAIPRLRRPDRTERSRAATLIAERDRLRLNTTIGVVATDARLDRAQTQRLAMSAHDGLARSIRPAHGLTDGDTVFGLATTGPATIGVDRSDVVVGDLDRLCAAAALAFERACVDAVLTAVTIGTAPAYRDVCPGAFRAQSLTGR